MPMVSQRDASKAMKKAEKADKRLARIREVSPTGLFSRSNHECTTYVKRPFKTSSSPANQDIGTQAAG